MVGVVQIAWTAASVVANSPGPVDLEARMENLGREILSLENRSPDELVATIGALSKQEALAMARSINHRRLGELTRWCMGVLLIRVKAELGHGNYGPWLEENRERLGFTQRTAENYSKLAKSYETLESFLESLQPKSDAHEAGDNEEEVESTVSIGDTESAQVANKPTKVELVLKDCTKLQKSFRHWVESGERFSRAELAQVKSVRRELDKLLEEVEGRVDED